MFCTKCGCRASNGDAFCRNCGNNLNSFTVNEPPNQIIDEDIQNVPTSTSSEHFSTTVLKSVCSSRLYLAATIAYAVSFLFGLIGLLLFNVSQQSEPFNGTVATADTARASVLSMIPGSVFILAPFIIIAVSLYNIYSQAKRPMGEAFNTSSITAIKVVNIISLIFVSYLTLMCASPLLIFLSDGDYSNAIPFTALLLLLVLLIVFQAFIWKSLNAIKKAVSGVPCKVSKFAAVMFYVYGTFSIILVPYSLIRFNAVLFIAFIASSVSNIFLGILMFRFNKKISN